MTTLNDTSSKLVQRIALIAAFALAFVAFAVPQASSMEERPKERVRIGDIFPTRQHCENYILYYENFLWFPGDTKLDLYCEDTEAGTATLWSRGGSGTF